MAEHHFDVDIACEYGVAEAILLYNLAYWIEKNRANNKHFHDGRYWTYNSIKAFKELFPYLSDKKIRNALSRLQDADIIMTGNYNEKGFDKTLWYAFTEKGEQVISKRANALPKRANGLPQKVNGDNQKGEPIPNNKPNIKPDNKTDSISRDVAETTSPTVISLQTNKKDVFFNVTEEHVNKFKECYQSVDIIYQLKKMQLWLESNPRKRKTERGMMNFINLWLGREQDKPQKNYNTNSGYQQGGGNNNENETVKLSGVTRL